ncbi:MAG: hypothetical protein ABEJ83_03650 [Candidatus Nanohaloarchaea archaeon]
MEEPDHDTNSFDIVEYIHFYKRTFQRQPEKEEILDGVDSAEENDLKGLRSVGYIDKNHMNGKDHFDLSPDGRDFYESGLLTRSLEENRDVNEHLIDQQRRSSAVETIFTLAILSFTYIQVMNIILTSNILKYGAKSLLGLTLTSIFGFAVYLAWKIGKENLMKTLDEKVHFIYYEK